MTVPLRSGLAAAGRRLDRTIRAQGQGSTVCGDRTVCYTGAAKVRRSALQKNQPGNEGGY